MTLSYREGGVELRVLKESVRVSVWVWGREGALVAVMRLSNREGGVELRVLEVSVRDASTYQYIFGKTVFPLFVELKVLEESVRGPAMSSVAAEGVGGVSESMCVRFHNNGKAVSDISLQILSLNSPTKRDDSKDGANANDATDRKTGTEEKQSASSNTLGKLGKRFFKSRSDEHRRIKAALGVLVGILLGGGLFVALRFSFQYSYSVAGGIAGAATLVMCVLLAVSVRARCVTALMSVSIFTGKGRAAFLSIIGGLLLMGPVTNIVNNTNEVADTMACITELAYNQSQMLQQRLEEPLKQVQDTLLDTASRIREITDKISAAFGGLKQGFSAVSGGLDQAANAFQKATRVCRASYGSVFSKCANVLSGAERSCRREISSITDKLNPGSVVDKIKGGLKGFIFRRKRDVESDPIKSRHTRAIADDICSVLKVGELCNGLKNIDLCSPLSLADNVITDGIKKILTEIRKVEGLFKFQLKNVGVVSGNANSSRSASDILDGIRTDLKEKLDVAYFVVNVINRVLSLVITLVLIQAFLYSKNYLSNLRFDNIYLTRQLKALDASRQQNKVKELLPLKRHEKKKYIDSTSFRLSPSEFRTWRNGMVTVLMHVLIAALLVLFDYLFYYILYLINKHGRFEFTLSGMSKIQLKVEGSGLLTNIFKTFISGFNIEQSYDSSLDIQKCLPKPSVPDQNSLYVLLVLYFLAIAFVVLQAYGLRLRHKIAAFYYPEQETARVVYLYRLIEVKRHSFMDDLKKMMSDRSVKPTEVKAKNESKKSQCWSRLPCFKKVAKVNCVQCEEETKNGWQCKSSGCQADFCKTCYKDNDKCCPLCHTK
ncbi:DC-STAMP domain-containing protein 2-like [Haliotis rubra]|uniref:DC-STAMP domain-containing protein 2-like n=1 Tax=Haliotis rubra TaxID=36100 RepID=UPI001EE60312|nr:DC-STAMP domain-containing protein 2-like [Haliotis rubra]